MRCSAVPAERPASCRCPASGANSSAQHAQLSCHKGLYTSESCRNCGKQSCGVAFLTLVLLHCACGCCRIACAGGALPPGNPPCKEGDPMIAVVSFRSAERPWLPPRWMQGNVQHLLRGAILSQPASHAMLITLPHYITVDACAALPFPRSP